MSSDSKHFPKNVDVRDDDDIPDNSDSEIRIGVCTDVRFSRRRELHLPNPDHDSLGFIITRNAAPPPASPAPPRPMDGNGESN